MAGITSVSGLNGYDYGSYGSINIGAISGQRSGNANGINWQVSGTKSSGESRSYLAAIKNFGSKLREATAKAARSSQSVFNKLIAASSKDEALTVSITDQTAAAKTLQSGKNVTIQQLATAQKNTGAALNATSLGGAKSGTNRFTLEKDGKTFSFNVNINVYDSARTAQQKMADAINKQKTGVNAAVEYDGKTGKSVLTLTSNETGAGNAFTVRDTADGSNLVSKLGVGQASEQARDAEYTVDGERRTSAKNTVELGGGVTGTLKKAGPDTLNVTAKKDIEGVSKVVRDITDNFNGLLKTARSSGDRGAQALRQRLDSIAGSYASSLRNIGITRGKDGMLEVDDKKLRKAFEEGSAERYLGDNSYGFTQRLSQIAKQADGNPGQFLSTESRRAAEAPASKQTDDPDKLYLRFMSSSRNVSLANAGLLLNMVV